VVHRRDSELKTGQIDQMSGIHGALLTGCWPMIAIAVCVASEDGR